MLVDVLKVKVISDEFIIDCIDYVVVNIFDDKVFDDDFNKIVIL